MNPRRRTTVHDLAALRLHRDGTRVANSDSNSASRRAKYTIRDARGNWVAKDAGGLGTVKLRPAASQPEGEQDDDGGESELEVDGELMEEEGVLPKADKGKGRARESGDEEEEIAVNSRAGKRRRFDEDFSYLDPVTPHIPGGEDPHSHPAEADPGTFPVPSADLLKCLHYFATAYYTAMGQLYDASRESRKERKIRRGQKFKKTEAAGSSPLSVGKELDDAQGSSDEEDIEFEEDEEGEEDEEVGEEGGEGDKERSKGRKRRPRASRQIAKDMYKLFDGSALMALGMLFQEHVAGLLEPNVPEGWDQEFALAERDRSAAEKRARRARQMWNQRHTVKGEGSEQPETESGGEGGEERSQEQEGIAVSDSDSSDSAADE